MAQIIQFRPREEHSNAYFNLIRLIPKAESIEAVNFYANSVESLRDAGVYLDGEYGELVEAYRSRRLELAKPEPQEPVKAEEPGVYVYTPEMGQKKPACQMEASRGYYGGHVYIDTPLELKGRGIRHLRVYRSEELTAAGQYKVGWNEYCVTNRAYEKLKEQYTISMQCCLD